ncbi:MAG: GUN4 domain-containing protein [Calothrix sp. MO_167.B42]|nr:GUN4 domain-containing protein [Calothrix sp. MO_167.B42]
MAEESKEQNTPMTFENFWKLLDSKFVSLGVPGALLAVALDFARKSEWKNVTFCAVGAAGIWLGIKVVNKLSPRIDKFLDWMARNPLLLNMIAITHEKNGTLSTKRIDLYKEICRVLLEGRQRAKGLSTNTDLSAKQKQVVLRSLALELTRQNTQAFTLDSSSSRDKIFPAQSLIKEKLERFPQQKITPEDFIKKDDLGVRELLSEREQEGIYEFAHKTFQEYLTAVEITISQQENLLFEAFTDEKKLAWYRETICFYAAQTDASNLIQTALQSEKISVLTLAYQCSKEAQEITPDVQQQLKDKLELGLESNNVDEFTLAAQVKLADRLSQLNHDLLTSESDLDRESIAVDSSYISWAEYQLFLNENNASPRTLENNKRANEPVTGISFWDANGFCAWLSLRSRKELGEPGICYRQPTQKDQQNADGKIQLLRFQVPPRYAELAYYLAVGMWKEADKETDKIMLKVAGREKQGYLELEDIRQFPCEDLRTIDQLWINYSNGHFGFSVQKEIYLSVGGILGGSQSSSPYIKKILYSVRWVHTHFGGAVRDESDQLYKAYSRLAEEVGWKVNGNWIYYQEVTFDTSSPKGHLPAKIKTKAHKHRDRSFHIPIQDAEVLLSRREL